VKKMGVSILHKWNYLYLLLALSSVCDADVICNVGDIATRTYNEFGLLTRDKCVILLIEGETFHLQKYGPSVPCHTEDCFFSVRSDDRNLRRHEEFCETPPQPESDTPAPDEINKRDNVPIGGTCFEDSQCQSGSCWLPNSYQAGMCIHQRSGDTMAEGFVDQGEIYFWIALVVIISIGLCCIIFKSPFSPGYASFTGHTRFDPRMLRSTRGFHIPLNTIRDKNLLNMSRYWSVLRSTTEKNFIKNFGTVIKPSARYKPHQPQPLAPRNEDASWKEIPQLPPWQPSKRIHERASKASQLESKRRVPSLQKAKPYLHHISEAPPQGRFQSRSVHRGGARRIMVQPRQRKDETFEWGAFHHPSG